VPESFSAQFVTSADESAPWLSRRRMFEAVNGDVVVPALADRGRSGEDVGGIGMTRTTEGLAIAEDTATFEQRRLALYKAATLVRVSNELLSDGVGVERKLRETFGRAVALRQSLDFLSGTGTGEPVGVLNAPATISVAKESMQTADTITAANIVNMRSRLAPTAVNEAVWLAHTSAYAQLLAAHLAGTNSDVFLFLGGNGAGEPATLLGIPIFFTEAASVLGDKGDISLVTPSQYLYVSRPLAIQMSEHYAFNTDQVAFRVTLRDNGMPEHRSTLTDAQGYEVSEFVTLAERA